MVIFFSSAQSVYFQ